MANARALAAFLVPALLASAPSAMAADGAPAAARARPEAVGLLGLSSPDVDADTLRAIESRIEEALARTIALRRREEVRAALSSDAETALALARARAAAAAADEAMRAFELAVARERLDVARDQFEAAFGEWLAPDEYGRVFEQRSRLFYALRMPAETRRELARLVPLRAWKGLDPGSMPPDALAMFEEEHAAARARPRDPPDASRAARLSRTAGLRWIVLGEARGRDGWVDIRLCLGSAAGSMVSRTVRLAPATPQAELERELIALLDQAGIAATARLERAIVPRPRPPMAAGRSRKAWYVLAAVLGVAAAGAGAAVLSRPSGKKGGTEEPVISIVFEDP